MSKGDLVLFHPHVSPAAIARVTDTLHGRWIGQGPLVDEFEQRFAERLGSGAHAVAVGSGTDALHLSYALADLKPGDEVIAPVFTCLATNIPLLHLGATLRFADIQPHTLNVDPAHVARLISSRTRAIVCTHYGGLPCDLDELDVLARTHGVPLIEDAAQALGATYRGRAIGTTAEFSAFSFQAIKHITTGDGGLLALRDEAAARRGRLLRWFGIDRAGQQQGTWDNDVAEAGFKYQMTDIAAAMGLAGLAELDQILAYRRTLLRTYADALRGTPGVAVLGVDLPDREHAAWICTVLVDDRRGLERKLRELGIEARQAHYRNDRYTIFRPFRADCPVMDRVEDHYLLLPLHTRMSIEDVHRVCAVLRSGW